jgi:tetratricopeptide (TPR) repeat protein
MLTAPLVVLVYDYVFESGSFKQALTKRWRLYGGLAATWLALGATVLAAPPNPTAGFEVATISSCDYLKSEFGVIVHYLRLSLWPRPLVLDYGWPKAESLGRIFPPALFVGAIFGATVWAVIRRKAAGFLGAWFFLIIGLTSSFMPFSDLAFEHRMYLPLAAVVSLLVIGGYSLAVRFLPAALPDEQARRMIGRYAAGTVVALLIAVLGLMTLRRNVYYQDPLVMWNDVVNKRPESPRGHNNLGMLLLSGGMLQQAVEQFAEACRLNPYYSKARCNLGSALTSMGKLADGETQLTEAIKLKSNYAEAYYILGRNLVAQGRLEEAVANFSLALEANSELAEAYFHRGLARKKLGRLSEAIGDFHMSLEKRPDSAEVLSHLAVTLAAQDDPAFRNPGEGVRLAERAVALTEKREPVPLDALGVTYAEEGRFPEAIDAASLAVDLAKAQGNADLAAKIQARVQMYQDRHVWRSQPLKPAGQPSPPANVR